MPYLALDLDAKRKCSMVGRATGLSPAEVCWGLLELWEFAWREGRAQVTGIELRACVGSHGELTAALEQFGFLEANAEGWRIRGAEKWLRVRLAQVEAGKKHAENLRRGPGGTRKEKQPLSGSTSGSTRESTSGSAPALTPSTQHPAPSTNYDDVPSSTATPKRVGGKRRLFIVDTDVAQPNSPVETWDAIGFWSWAEACRRKSGWPPEPQPPGLTDWWPKALELAGGVERLAVAYRDGFAADQFWRKATPPCPFGGFMSQTPRYLS